MEELKNELKMFFEDNGLPTEIIEEDNWIEFIKLLVGILSDQPIINSIPEIVSINFIPISPGFVICRVDLKNQINGYAYYEYKIVLFEIDLFQNFQKHRSCNGLLCTM